MGLMDVRSVGRVKAEIFVTYLSFVWGLPQCKFSFLRVKAFVVVVVVVVVMMRAFVRSR